MQPNPFQISGLHVVVSHMVADVFGDHGQHFFEDFAAVLHELHVAAVVHRVMGAAQEPVVIAYIIAELRGAAG